MASLGQTFDPTSHDTTQSSTLPLGIYRLEAEAGDVVPTKAGDGTVLKLIYKVIEPTQFAERKFFANINIENKSPVAQKIGQEELAKLCRSIELSQVNDSDDLLFKSFVAKVGLEKPQPGYEPKNKIVRFYYPDEGNAPEPSIDANQPAPAPVTRAQAPANDNRPAASTPAAAASGGRRPWGK